MKYNNGKKCQTQGIIPYLKHFITTSFFCEIRFNLKTFAKSFTIITFSNHSFSSHVDLHKL
jgi:hypothetical protein